YRLPRGGRNEAAGIVMGAAGAVVGTIGLAVWTATQYVALRLHFDPRLGAPLLAVTLVDQVWLGPPPVVGAAPGVASLTSTRTRGWAGWLFLATGLLLTLRIGPLYPPFQFFLWWWRFGDTPGTTAIWTTGMWIVTIPSHLAVFVGLVVSIRRARRIGGQSGTPRSAPWATPAHLPDPH